MRALALAALVFAAVSGGTGAMTDDYAFYQQALALAAPFDPARLPGQNDTIVPHAGIDPDMTIAPPQFGARMPVIEPPGTLDQPKQ
jgi:hypothetical protein